MFTFPPPIVVIPPLLSLTDAHNLSHLPSPSSSMLISATPSPFVSIFKSGKPLLSISMFKSALPSPSISIFVSGHPSLFVSQFNLHLPFSSIWFISLNNVSLFSTKTLNVGFLLPR